MNRYIHGVLAGLCITLGYDLWLSRFFIHLPAARLAIPVVVVAGGGVLLSRAGREGLNRNLLAAACTLAGWLLLTFTGLGNLFLPLFGNVGGSLPGQFLYGIMGPFLLPVPPLCYLLARIVLWLKRETQ